MRTFLSLVLVGLVAHVVGAVVAEALFHQGALAALLRGEGVVFFTACALVPMLGLAGAGAMVTRVSPTSVSVRWMRAVGVPFGLISSLAAQVAAWSAFRSDAQAGLLFLFLPLWAAVATGVVAFIALLAGVARSTTTASGTQA